MKTKLLLLFCILILVGCSPKTDEELYYQVQKKLNDIDSYYCQVEIKSIGNKEPQLYTMEQWFEKPDKYKLRIILPDNIKGKTTVSKGNKALIYNPNIEQTWIMEDFRNSEEQNMFLGYFIKNVLNSEDVTLRGETKDDGDYLIITTDIPGNHGYYHREQLYINTKTMKPYLLQVYDAKDQLRIEVKYMEFKYNPSLEKSTFYLDETDQS